MKKLNLKKLNFKKLNGLIPAIIQDAQTNQVLMLGFMNEKALKATMTTGLVTFWSRSKNRLWQKGETSGNYLKVSSIYSDCDNDTILVKAQPIRPTCHTGAYSCFSSEKEKDIIRELFRVIKERKQNRPANSYTTTLFNAGLKKINAKIKEESAEVVKAANHETKKRLIEESVDLIYHLFVLLAYKNIKLTEVEKEMKKRRNKKISPA